MSEDLLKKITSHAKEYGFIFPSSEIYDGLAAVYDYGQNGVELKKNIRDYWWKSMVQLHETIVGIDTAIFIHPIIWKASGHLDAFKDPLIDNRDSKKRYRADVLLEDYAEKQRQKAEKEIQKAAKRFGDSFDEKLFRKTSSRVKKYMNDAKETLQRTAQYLEASNLKAVKKLIEEKGIADPVSGSKNWTDVRQFNLMFATQMNFAAGETDNLYLRPETAQGIFVNFLNVQKTARMKIPFGIAQTGKAFRNEIVARQFIFRMREFEQMEMQFFVRPSEEMKWYEYWKKQRLKWHLALGMDASLYRYYNHEKLAHYASAASDIEFDFPFGFKELEGIHSRTDFDLKKHEKYSGKRLKYFDPELNKSYTPYVIETSVGIDRLFFSILSGTYCEEKMKDGSERVVLSIPPALAPVKVAVLPLLKKDGLPKIAQEIIAKLELEYNCQYDEKDTIGKRYRRHDAIGTPICITVDHQTKEDCTVTLRDRDTTEQIRVSLEELNMRVGKKVNPVELLLKLK